jgi:peptidoglycan hydrolase-like protein with peptidoglycan-binding domain
MWAEMQAMARTGGYTGPLDGVMGANSWRGFQNYLKFVGLDPGVSDGIPGPNTYKAMQRFAAWHGYAGPIDGVMGPNSWRGFDLELQVVYYGP